MRWMLLVVVASAISVACRAALCAGCAAARGRAARAAGPRTYVIPRAPPREAGASLARARPHTAHTHAHAHAHAHVHVHVTCACACGRVHAHAHVRVWPCPWAKDLPTLTPVNRRPISDVG